jgi:CheY-like chemotaxis protein
VHSLLTDAHWQSADLQKLIQDQLLEVAVDERRLIASGPAVRLEPQMTVHLALMLHELGTNSAKYGALAAAGGTVTIAWTVEDKNLSLRWVERGGPPVRAPIVRGFGTSLIEQSANSDGGHAEMLCEATGVTWKINLPLREQAQPASLAKPDSFAPRPHPQQPAVTRAALRGLRLLVVEDEPLIALDLADMLEKAGAEVVGPVGTVSGALESIDSGGLDAVLLDANLHGASVDAVASALTRRQIPFVFVTGYGRSGLETAFKHAPVLTKPVSPADLIEVFARLTERDSSVVRLNREEGDAVARGQ